MSTLRAYLKEGLKQLKKASPDQSTKLILEIKTSQLSKQRTLELTSACVALVKELEAQPLVDYICFDYDAGLKVLELDPEAQVSFLSSNAETPPAKLKKDGYTGFDYHFSVMKSNPEFVQQAQALGLTSNAWTVNQEKDMEEMLELNLDFITTDMPAFLLKKIQ